MSAKMHGDELDLDVPLVRRLVAAQLPDWAALPLERVPSAGRDNALFRVAVAWQVFGVDARIAFRDALEVDGATWARARGWVASQAVGALAYYTGRDESGARRRGTPLAGRGAGRFLGTA